MLTLLAIGANIPGNIGPPLKTFQWCTRRLEATDIDIRGISPFYISSPLAGKSIPDFINGALLIDTHMPVLQLLKHIKELEREAGRKPGQFWGSRPLDIDIISTGNLSVNWKRSYLEDGARGEKPSLVLPHPDAHLRDFVLQPVLDLLPFWHHPVSHVAGKTLLKKLALKAGHTKAHSLKKLPACYPGMFTIKDLKKL